MKHKIQIWMLIAGVFFALVNPKPALASLPIKGQSAYLTRHEVQLEKLIVRDERSENLKSYLESYNSPLAPYAKTFIETADQQKLDWKLVAAIAGVESYFGQMIPPYSYNGWGYYIYGNNTHSFASWDDGIRTVSQALRNDYLGTLEASDAFVIGPKYAADPMWAAKVTRFMAEIDTFASKVRKSAISITL